MNNLQKLIIDKIQQQGSIKFSTFMEMALYTPYLGYYNQANINIGKHGDFTTACEISYLFGQTIANAIQHENILELGAGSGKLAGDIINKLKPEKYFILERSAFLRQQQQSYLQQINIDMNKVEWLDNLPNNFTGTIIANEVLDAIPADMYYYNISLNQWQQRLVNFHQQTQEFIWNYEKITNKLDEQNLLEFKKYLPLESDLNENYIAEIHSQTASLLTTLANIHTSGQMIWIDYGFLAHEYYHPQRNMGTLMCYHKHKANTNPFINLGQQDISVHVNFSLVLDVLKKQHYELEYFDNQARFLLDYGILDELQLCLKQQNYLSIAKQAQVLLSEAEMGAIFKVLIMNKN